MARRNIFDRDTRAGDYSDTLGNFLESIPSIYGQLAKEKRLERQDREDRNFRTTQYNNQLLQQAKINKRQDDSAQLTRDRFEQNKKDKDLQNEILLATGLAEKTGDYRPLIQLRQRHFSTPMDEETSQNQINEVTQFMSDKDDFESRLDDFNSLSYMKKFEKGNELRDLISISSRFSKVGDTQNKNYYKAITKNLRDTLKDVASKSGKNILNTSLWDNPTLVDAYQGLDRDIKDKEKQISATQTEINKILPIATRTAGSDVPSSLNRLAVLNKDGEVQKDKKGNTILESNDEYRRRLASLGYNKSNVNSVIEFNNRITGLRNERANLTFQKNNLIPKYPVYNDNYEENLETIKAGRPSAPENNQPIVVNEDAESNILSKIDDMDEEGISEFLSAVETSDMNALNDYFFGESDTIEFNQGSDEPEQPPVNLADAETEPTEQIDLELENENVLQDETKPESEDTILPIVSATPVQQFSQNVQKDDDAPKINLERKIPITSKEFDDLDIKDAKGQNVTLNDNLGAFNKKIDNMVSRIKDLNKIKRQSGAGNQLQRRQFKLEQEQLIRDLYTIFDSVLSLDDSFVNRGGSKKSVGYKKSIQQAIKKIPTDLQRD